MKTLSLLEKINGYNIIILKTYDIKSTYDRLIYECKIARQKYIVARDSIRANLLGSYNGIRSLLKKNQLVIADSMFLLNRHDSIFGPSKELESLLSNLYFISERQKGQLVIITPVEDYTFERTYSKPLIIYDTNIYLPEEYTFENKVIRFFRGLTKQDIRNFLKANFIRKHVEFRYSLIHKLNQFKINKYGAGLVTYNDIPNVSFSMYVHSNNTTKTLELMLDKRRNRHNNVLLFGEPGTGKTMFAKCIANKYKYDFVTINISNLLDKFFGETEKNMQRLLLTLDIIDNAVIIFDEGDKLFSGALGGINNFMSGSLSIMLQWLEKRHYNRNIIFMCINHKEYLPPELLRSGRWNLKAITTRLNDYKAQKRAWLIIARKFHVRLAFIPKFIHNLVFADIVDIIQKVKAGISLSLAINTLCILKLNDI